DLCDYYEETATYVYTAPTTVTYTAPAGDASQGCEFDAIDLATAQGLLDADLAAWVTAQQAAVVASIQGGCSVSVTNNFTSSTLNYCEDGSVTITWTIEDLCDYYTETATYVYTAPDDIVLDYPADKIVGCMDQNLLNIEFANWLAEFDYSGGCSPQATFDPPNPTPPDWCGSEPVVVTYTVTDLCDQVSITRTFTVDCFCDGFCFYTKGFYGNEGGLGWTVDCDMQYTALQMMQAVLPAGSEEFGILTNNFTLVSGDITAGGNIFNMLPGGSTPAVLGGGEATYANTGTWWVVPIDDDPSNYGSIQNNLLAQAIAFYFNLGNNPDALGHTIDGNVLVTIESDCSFETYTGDPQSFPIPQSVIDELGGYNTLGDLLQLAKDVLGGANSNVSPADVTAALDAFNRGFDECRAFVEYQNTLSIPSGDNTSATATTAKEVEVTAYPNPFRGDVTIEFTVPQTINVTLEIYTLEGQRVETLFTGMAEKDAIHTYHFDGNGMSNQSVFIYVIKSEYGINMGKIIRLK
ncbi:MAG TPA: T9SS type A sorting domain-containing protein, partial [Bacteroidales bacterium]|nr:T9SS type A sorting domain-containing protein [Bacteroidales bacterium]